LSYILGTAFLERFPMTPSPRPTDAELAILRVLWERGPSTVRQVFEVLSEERELGYTTVLKMLQIMDEKGLVQRDASDRVHVFSTTQTQAQTQRSLLDDLLDKAFGGSSLSLVMQALATRRASREELAEIRKLLDQAEGGKR
jgi:predicted transcriptional regulator